MNRRLITIGGWLVAGCGSPEPVDDTGSLGGACGAVTSWDLAVIATVEEGGVPVSDALVTLEDRGWEPITILGEAVSAVDGSFHLEAEGVTAVEGCWGSLLDYVVVAEHGDRRGERRVNQALYRAIEDGTLEADLGVPITLQ